MGFAAMEDVVKVAHVVEGLVRMALRREEAECNVQLLVRGQEPVPSGWIWL